jgi:hypothetical protein
MHQEEQSQASISKIEKKECSRKSSTILIHKSKTFPKVINKKLWKEILSFSMFKSS